jgi:cardiolipin hydrolase
VDSSLLVNGSFNWTASAVMGNNENVVVTNNTLIVARFLGEFNKLWQLNNSPASGDS